MIFNVLLCASADRMAAHAATREKFTRYTQNPLYAALFRAAGFDISNGLPDALIEELVVWGDQPDLIDGLRQRLALPGVGELRVIPVWLGMGQAPERKRWKWWLPARRRTR